MKSNKKNFRHGLCSKNEEYYEDDIGYQYTNESSQTICCGIICAKSLAIIFNFLFILTGVLLILMSSWTISTKQDYVNLLTSSLYQASTYILIIAGIIIAITGVIGILSAWFESRNFLIVYIILLVTIFLIEITAAVLAFAYRARLRESIKQDFNVIILEQYGQIGFEEKTTAFDELQQRFKCCGATSFFDWQYSKYVQDSRFKAIESGKNSTYNKASESCCKTPSNLCAKRDHPSNINHNGCVSALEKYITNHILLIGVVSCGICSFQAIGLLIASFLIKRINQRMQYNYVKANESGN